MHQNNFVLPQQCTNCGTLFDLWYEMLEGENNPKAEEIEEKLGKKVAESLCWDCKQEAIKSIPSEKESSDELSNNESDDDLFLDWEIE